MGLLPRNLRGHLGTIPFAALAVFYQAAARGFWTTHSLPYLAVPACVVAQVANTIAAAHPDKPRPSPPVTALARMRNDVAVVPTQTGNQLVCCAQGVFDRFLLLCCSALEQVTASRIVQGAGMWCCVLAEVLAKGLHCVPLGSMNASTRLPALLACSVV